MAIKTKFCSKKICERCGKCCIFTRNQKLFSEKEDYSLRKAMYDKKGIVYYYPLGRYGISLSPKEVMVLREEADKKNIKLNIKPKKMLIEENGEIFLYDYFLDYDSCPFYRAPECTIYKNRPKVCREFPNLKDIDTEELNKFLKSIRLKKTGFEEALDAAKKHIEG